MRATLILLVFLIPRAASAESTLLLQVHEHAFAPQNFIGERVVLGFVTEWPNSYNQTRFEREYTATGATPIAAEQVQGFEAALTTSTGVFALTNNGFTPGGLSVDQIWNPPPTTYTTTAYVPKLAYGMYGYDITGITHSLDALGYYQSGQQIYSQFTHTISIYGEALPPRPVYPPLTGDYNQNGKVDTADYVVWREMMMQPAGSRPDLPNALNCPRPADEIDYGVWKAYYGESVPPIGASAVPEPAAWLLVLCGLTSLLRWHS
jgi:hypothetical protein